MKDRPGIAFRCGPLALLSIALSENPTNAAVAAIHSSASTQKGFSLSQVAVLSKQIGLNYQMAFRQKGAPFVVPSVVHWRVVTMPRAGPPGRGPVPRQGPYILARCVGYQRGPGVGDEWLLPLATRNCQAWLAERRGCGG